MSVATMAHCPVCGLYFGAAHPDVARGLCGACGGALTLPRIVSTIDVMYAREPLILLDAEGRVVESPDVRERLESLAAELRWCDAERRLALRALAEYAPVCGVCSARAVAEVHYNGDGPSEFNCARHRPHWKPCEPLVCAAQIAAADEETRK